MQCDCECLEDPLLVVQTNVAQGESLLAVVNCNLVQKCVHL